MLGWGVISFAAWAMILGVLEMSGQERIILVPYPERPNGYWSFQA